MKTFNVKLFAISFALESVVKVPSLVCERKMEDGQVLVRKGLLCSAYRLHATHHSLQATHHSFPSIGHNIYILTQ